MNKLYGGSSYTLAMEVRMPVIDDDELDKTLENTNLDKFKVIDSPQEQLNNSLQENTGVGSASTMGTDSTLWLAPRNRSNVKLCSGVDPCQESSLSSTN